MKWMWFVLVLFFVMLAPLWSDFICHTDSAGLDVFNSTSGVQVGDVNSDGLFDLMFTARDFGVLLFLADSPFHFSEVSWSLPDAGYTRGATLLDIDNDADLDAFAAFLYVPSMLYRNDGAVFTDITSAWGFDVPDQGEGTTCLDYNRDGEIDVFVGRYHAVKKLFHNNGTSLIDITIPAGFDGIEDGNDLPSTVDFDGDGWTDISISGNEHYVRLFHNNGDGTFSNFYLNTVSNTFGHDWADFDNDGDMDLAVSIEGRPNIFRNDDSVFVEVGEELGITDVSSGLGGCNWGDYDNDGWLDLLVSQTSESFLYRNIDGTHFEDVTSLEGLDTISNACGAAWVDLDEDGFLDIVISRWENGPKSVLKNIQLNNNSWIEIDVEGIYSPKDAVGTKITVFADDMHFTRQVGSNHGYASQNPYRVHFGLGNLRPAIIDSIVIDWTSGLKNAYYDVIPNFIYSYIEDTTSAIYEKDFKVQEDEIFYVIGRTIVSRPHIKGTLQVFDIMGRNILSRELPSNKIKLPDCSAGIYFVKFTGEDGRMTTRRALILK